MTAAENEQTFKRKQRVSLIYGRLTNGYAVGHYGIWVTIVSTRRRRRGWYGVQLNNGALASAHVSGLKRN